MKNKSVKMTVVLALALAMVLPVLLRLRQRGSRSEMVRETRPFIGNIINLISTTGTILPKNRLEIKPPVGGRMESVLVKEGQHVAAGQTLAWMSSTERAALLDYARGQGEAALAYWQEAYKPIALLAPIGAEVIVATTQPGQTVTANDAVIVLSDHLIARAQADETDIAKIKTGQKAVVNLDAYPETRIAARVDHIYYESKTVNNVTIYEVDLLLEDAPSFLRSGMNANINFIQQSKDNVLLILSEALQSQKEEGFVWVSRGPGQEPDKRVVKTGISDDKNTEILSGISEEDTVIIKARKYSLPKVSTGRNPFMPGHR